LKKRSFLGAIIYVVILASLLSWMLGLFGDGTNGLTYSEVVDLFRNEQVRSFEVHENKIYMELHTPLEGDSSIIANLADVESFRQELGQTFQDQKAAGILESYDFLPKAAFNPYALVIPLILAGGVLLLVWFLMMGRMFSEWMETLPFSLCILQSSYAFVLKVL